MPAVNPLVLKWARETAGLTLHEAAKKISLNDAYGKKGAQRLAELEEGAEEPSRALIERMADKYRRPIVAFYISAPPPKGNRGRDFRTVAEADSPESPIVDALLREIHARQSMLRSALEEADEAEVRGFVDSMEVRQGPYRLANQMRDVLELSHSEFWKQSSPEAALNLLRRHAEEAGVFVLLIGNLGSHHTTISVDTFRGFAIADNVAPFIVVNSNDAKTAQSFTLLHEFAHILLGQTGISGSYIDSNLVERVCNDAASEFLVPADALAQLQIGESLDQVKLIARIEQFASARNVSRSMVAYKLYRSGRLDKDDWLKLRDHFRELWWNAKRQRRRRNRSKPGGPNPYILKRYSAGPALMDTTTRLLHEGVLSPVRASQVLRVKPSQLGKLLGTSGARS